MLFPICAEAGMYIRRLAFLVPFMYIDTVTDALLKGLGEQLYCMKVNMADAFVSLVLVVILTPTMGLGGYVLSMYACEIMNLGLSVYKLWDRLGTAQEKQKIPGSLQNQGL